VPRKKRSVSFQPSAWGQAASNRLMGGDRPPKEGGNGGVVRQKKTPVNWGKEEMREMGAGPH